MAHAGSLPNGSLPAIFGGRPIFPDGLPLVRPSVPDAEEYISDVRRILESGVLTNGPFVRLLEEQAAEYLGVRQCVAVSSCTAGLMLVLRGADLSGDVLVPSFTFSATVHAVAWNGLRPVFVDVDPSTLTLSATAVARAVGVRTSAILATHTYGTPCDVEGLASIAEHHGIRLFFDAAHAFGSRRAGVSVGGFGDAEVFSLSPTKLLVAGEGGIIAVNDDVLAERCRIGRDYGNPGDYDSRFVGLNARMSELHAALALHSLRDLDERIHCRNEIAARYREGLSRVPGIRFAEVSDGDRSTYKDFTILVNPDLFGMEAVALGRALELEGIETRRYYSPPVHAHRAYRTPRAGVGGLHSLDVTEAASEQVLTLPMWSSMTEDQVAGVIHAIERLQRYAGDRVVVLPEIVNAGDEARGG